MNVSSHYWSPFHAKDCVFSRNEQQKMYSHLYIGRTKWSGYLPGYLDCSCLGKLFCSILNQRLLEYIVSLNILHKSQIGFFLPNNRTADHVFTLNLDKYVHNHNEKIYACFADFKKAFDSVWHYGLLHKLLQINVGAGFIYNLIKSLYHNSSCSIKIGQKQTASFYYAKGVR